MIYVRYQQIKLILKLNPDYDYLEIYNGISFGFGIVAVIGITIVGNFQVLFIYLKFISLKIYNFIFKEVNVNSAHYAGAVMAFGGFLIYLIFQIILSDHLSFYLFSSNNIFIGRFVIVGIAAIVLILCKIS